MTFVDNSTVSYSNPVRQTLFTFEDAKSGVEKALAAAEAVKRILPTVVSLICYKIQLSFGPAHIPSYLFRLVRSPLLRNQIWSLLYDKHLDLSNLLMISALLFSARFEFVL